MSERKKLGEMGHQPHGINPTTGEPEVFCIEFSPEERREYTKATINGWEAFKWNVGFADGRLPTFEEFCESEGL
jgi:hypothetical protein